jgi:hypothetical protein
MAGDLSRSEQARAAQLYADLQGRVEQLGAWIASPHYTVSRGMVLGCIDRIDAVLTELGCVAQLERQSVDA